MLSVTRILAITLALTTVTGCGDSSTSKSEETTSVPVAVETTAAAETVVVRVEPAASVDESVLRQAVKAYEVRLAALGIVGSVAISDGGLVLTLHDVSAPDRLGEDLAIEVAPESSVTIRPVLSRSPVSVGASVLTPLDEVSEDAEAVLDAYSSADDVVYQVGPAALSGSSVKSATAEIEASTGGWQISIEFVDGPDGLDGWNELVSRCYARDATCPDGGMAIVVDSKVVSAPVPQMAEFDSPTIVISGVFSEAEATELAQLLGPGPAIPFRVVPQ